MNNPPDVVVVSGAIRRFTSFRIALISQLAVTMNCMVAASLQFIADRGLASAGEAFNQIIRGAHLREDTHNEGRPCYRSWTDAPVGGPSGSGILVASLPKDAARAHKLARPRTPTRAVRLGSSVPKVVPRHPARSRRRSTDTGLGTSSAVPSPTMPKPIG